MKESIHIKNLGPIKDILIKDIKPLTILIGESAGGKSTVMKCLILCRWLYKMCNLREYLRQSGKSKSPFRFRMERHIAYPGLLEYVNPNSEIRYTVYYGEVESFSVIVKNKKVRFEGSIPQQELSYEKLCYITETRGFIPNVLSTNSRRPTYEALFEEMLENFEYACKALPKLLIPCLGVTYSIERTSSGIKHFVSSLKGSDYKIEYRHSSSGVQNTVPILLLISFFAEKFDSNEAFNRTLLKYLMYTGGNLTDFKPITNSTTLPKNIFVHLEEPELGLFPDAQCDMMNAVVNYCFRTASNPVNLVFTTHSPYILNHLNLLIRAHDTKNTSLTEGASLDFENVAVYHLEDGGIEDLKNIEDQRLINTNILSDTMNSIYNNYAELLK